MFHFAADRTRKAVTQEGVIFAFFAPMSALLNPDNPRLYGIMLEVPSDVSEDFDIDVKLNGDTIFVGTPPTFAASGNTQFILLDIDAPDTAGPIEVGLFEEVTIEALTLPTGGIPAGMKASLVFDDQVATGGGGGGVTDHGALTGLADDDHPQYLTQAEADALYAPVGGGGGGGGVTDHGALTGLGDDDHPQYQLRSERNAANGYAGLDGAGLIPDNRLPASIARDTEVTAAVAAHEAAGNPHPQYLTQAEGDALYEQLGGGGGGGGGGFTATDHITGFEIKRSGGAFDEDIEISPGSAYVPGIAEVVSLNAAVVRVPGAPQNGWNYVYLFKNGGGNADIEISQTAPAFYRGDAQHKTGDNTRRFVGCYFRDGVVGVYNFTNQTAGPRSTYILRRTLYSTPWLLLNEANVLGTDTQVTPLTASGANLLPPFCAVLHLIARLAVNANSRSFFGLSQLQNDVGDNNPWGAEVFLENDNQTGAVVEKMYPCEIRMDRARQSFYYYIQQFSGGGPKLTLHLRGLTFRR